MPPSVPSLAPGGLRYAAVALALALPAALVATPLAVACVLAAAAVAWFHRDPDRSPPTTGFVSPADGRVTVLRAEATDEGDRIRVGVFMNVTDVHVNRAPADGRVVALEHTSGGHWPAFTKDSERNERVHIDCGRYAVTLIAGTVARRIHPYVEPGEELARGQRIGHISFGSRVDVLLPATCGREDLRVGSGSRVRAGETVIAVDGIDEKPGVAAELDED